DRGQQHVSGPPVFRFAGYSRMVRGTVGTTSHAALSVTNAGGSARGVRVTMWGDALDRGLLAIESVQLVVRQGESMSDHDELVQSVTSKGNQILSAEFDVPIAAAIIPDERLPHPEAVIVHVNVKPRVLAAGMGSLAIGFVPLFHPDGQYGTAL